ncbi:TetR/AcrR family transcriptional regulator [Thermomonospora cellulosilytica]|uniref:AcrR family transcriptional regulator n=1 Tax=Thermomonospora cellulosilytica TaxID=1411118 RepID=A0A7W3MTS0_9ACTN|nr:TetR/AcrR family transcriptional regulator [Thermomonospora cellulosilytica]MBA9001698.1 AcrR family transcriptional regulator [Thermomonospora cellulosilytica]
MADTTVPPAETGPRARTRRAILDAAVSLLSKNPAASLGDVAAAAGVGRTTVHRYFPERSDLLTAISADLLAKIAMATDRARVHRGTALEALERLCQEYFELGDGLLLVFEDPEIMNWEGWQEETDADRALLGLVERGHAEGSIDPAMDPHWVQQVMWSLLYAAWQHSRDDCVPRHAALAACLRTLKKALAA